ncbi:Exodeoxyribonuclease VII small subunit [Bathymodiolus thermophilus thioautotrophic gill symbiont]|uniref:Exodeoxyribonuclease 7 small subunit n=1 Tax=Bathymodiolus thermophilus thioautotrophic gill symbiont TaxID=2360 RepID=A0A1J5UGV0_9GAMM|nr:exodeoxyribonuclease VII small subunit [Bathymodiolus thermophilus thioautotrophic gill symbiont]OIR25141.1 exodeoxyribonuclease VII small subunit [Bathymodiolus thermophilus thioautotrophic gill symbiont]CAB5497691.1 Exodeoxyribonuclease VII small subunit (EC [Bathymodiolus thermophilus thioautotrophic gill symbiont]CAB5504207.1 Exodeoxyribonuclease VII small subunit (EC [Bathymodiolus thermophilus thioautotrophic gill symbiont]SGZ62988.1 Exodeoxyribonuclease VII small subunit [Bathymodiolu
MAKKFDFNKGLKDLEVIVQTMESGDLNLEDSLKHFERGVALTRQCQTALSEAEQKIAILSADDNYHTQQPLIQDSNKES